MQGDDEVLASKRIARPLFFWKKQRWYKRRSFITNGVSVKGPITKNGQERIITETQIHELVWEMGDSQRSITTWCLSPTRWWRLVLSSSRSRLEVTNLRIYCEEWLIGSRARLPAKGDYLKYGQRCEWAGTQSVSCTSRRRARSIFKPVLSLWTCSKLLKAKLHKNIAH